MTRTYLLGASVAALLSATSAFAADLPAVAPYSAAAPAAMYDWTGVYVGLQAGYAFGDADRENTAGFANSFDINGFVGGVHAGYNYQINSIVLGVEGDVEFSGIDGDDAGVGGNVDKVDFNWMASLRGRLGVAFNRVLVYTTGGVAFADVDATTTSGGASTSDSNSHVGWTLGAGVEVAVTQNVTARVEYRYTDFNDKTYTLTPTALNANYDYQIHAVRVGVSYKF